MIRSFRLRLAVLSALLGGLILGAFSFATWWLLRDTKISQIKQEVREQAEREVTKKRSFEEWQRLEARIVSGLGIRSSKDLFLLVEKADGQILYRSAHWHARLDPNELPWPAPETALSPRSESSHREDRDRPPPGPPPAAITSSLIVDGHLWHFGLATTSFSRVAVAVDSEIIDADMKGMRNALLFSAPFVLVLIGVGAWFISNQAMRPLQKLMAATQRISAEALNQRIPQQDEDREFAALIEVFNTMLERLERSFNQAHRFSADAAHELKTPLAILQGQLERAIDRAEAGSPLQSELSSILDEVQRLSTISRKLLILSQADAGRLNLHREAFALSDALTALSEDALMLAPHLKVSCDIQPGLIVFVDVKLFPQILHNLISNAIKYNRDDGWIHISALRLEKSVKVCIANSSQEFTDSEQAHLFERFFRTDSAHGRNIDGVGLGLSLSREIARAHGGDLTFLSHGDGSAHFTLFIGDRPT